MPHPDFDPAWLDEDLNVWAERALKADERSRPGSVKRVTKRNRYLLGKYLDVIRDHGFAGAIEATIAEAEEEGHSDDMVRVALEPWRKAHPQRSERAAEDRLRELEARGDRQASEIRLIHDWIARRNAEAIESRIHALEEHVGRITPDYIKAGVDAAAGALTRAEERILAIEERLRAIEAPTLTLDGGQS